MEIKTLAEQLLFTAVRIETQRPDGAGTATGFIFSFNWEEKDILFLVTNKHVVRNATTGRFFFTKRDGEQPEIGEKLNVEMTDFAAGWHDHPDPEVDITISPLAPLLNRLEKQGTRAFIKAIPSALVPNAEQISELDVLEEVLFVGYPNGIYDTTNLMPIFRRGTTATPLQVDYEGRPIFLVDASVFPGSSGSPVLLWSSGTYTQRDGGVVVGSRQYLLGVIAEVAFREEHGKIEFVSVPTAKVPIARTKEMLDLGIVYKASTINETVVDFLRARNLMK